MQLVFTNQPGGEPQKIRDLSDDERQALLSSYQDAQSEAGLILLKMAWNRHWWFACECRGERGNPPVLFVRRNFQGNYTLVQMKDRPAHLKECPFHRVLMEKKQTSKADDNQDIPELGQLLYRWINAAKLNQVNWPGNNVDLLGSQYASLREVARSLNIAPNRHLGGYMKTHLQAAPRLGMKLQRVEKDWPGGEPFGILLLTINEISDAGEFKTDQGELVLPIENIHQMSCTKQAGGPYLAIIKITKDKKTEKGLYLPSTAFIHPIYSCRQLMLVDSRHERDTLKKLLEMQNGWLYKKHVMVGIRKTLPYTKAYDQGISFQLQRLNRNGRVTQSVDVISVDGDVLNPGEHFLLPEQDGTGVYHLVGKSQLDKKFVAILTARLLGQMDSKKTNAKKAGRPKGQVASLKQNGASLAAASK